MDFLDTYQRFYDSIAQDGRIGPVHIAVYMALLHQWDREGRSSPIHVFSRHLMPAAKIAGIATYYRTMKELNLYGYIKYVSTYDRVLGSLVYILELKRRG